MTQEELRTVLLREHARDKRLTYISYSLILVVILLILVFFGKYLLSLFTGEQELYPKLMIGGILLFYAGFALKKILTFGSRQRDIDEMLLKAQSGAKAMHINDYKEYRIILPLGKITYRMCPVEYQMIQLDSDPRKVYRIACHPAVVTDLKGLLSGADLRALDQQIGAIYNAQEPVETDGVDATPLRTAEEFRQYIASDLGGTLHVIEDQRKFSRKWKFIMGAVVAVLMFGLVGYSFWNSYSGRDADPASYSTTNSYLPILIGFGAFYLVYLVVIRPKMMKASTEVASDGSVGSPEFVMKNKVFSKMVEYMAPGAQYVMHGHISREEFLASGMFREAHYKMSGSNLVIGRHKGVPFQFCDLAAQVQKKITKENEEPDYAFNGQFFTARFNKSFNAPVHIVPRGGLKGFFSSEMASVYAETGGEKIQLEDPEFMELFTVYGYDQIEARYILTPSLMERIKEIAKRDKGQLYVTFYGNRITVANNGISTLYLKPGQSVTDNDYKAIVDLYQDLYDQFSIIDDLKLNIKIWN